VLTYFGTNTKLKPWGDIHVRRAVAYPLDRTALITANGGPSSAIPATTLIPTDDMTTIAAPTAVASLIDSLPQYPYNVSLAKQQMAESAYPKGFTATTDTYDQGSNIDVVQVVAGRAARALPTPGRGQIGELHDLGGLSKGDLGGGCSCHGNASGHDKRPRQRNRNTAARRERRNCGPGS
jgi:Bacterial extracellular solute-binding proteins, family 5 Middle